MRRYERVAPTEQVEEYLHLRQRLKQEIKKKNQNNQQGSASSANSEERKRKLPNDNYGSFFGPSETVISRRVIGERKPIFAPTPSKSRSKVEKLKHNRDYSFLFSSDDASDGRPLSSKPAQPVLTSNKVRKLKLSPEDDELPEPSKVAPQTNAEGSRNVNPTSSVDSSRPRPDDGDSNGTGKSKKVSSSSSVTKISVSEDEAAVRIIRKLFGYDPSKYGDRDDDVSIEDIIREDTRIIARRKDEQQKI